MTNDHDEVEESLDLMDALIESRDPDETLLTTKQRAYLRANETGLKPSTERSRRRTIRGRVQNALVDLAVVFEHLDPTDRAQLVMHRKGGTAKLQDFGQTDETHGPPELFWSYLLLTSEEDVHVVGTGGLRQVIALVVLSLHDALVENLGWDDEDYELLLTRLLEGAISDSLAKSGRCAAVDVSIDITDVDMLPDTVETVEDLQLLSSHRAIQPEEYWEFIDNIES